MFTLQDNDIFLLFDTGEVDHVCNLIADTQNVTPKNHKACLAHSLNELAIIPIGDYVSKLYEIDATGSIESALKLKEKLEVIARLLELTNDCEVFHDASFLAKSLKGVWLEFIAYNSAYRIYHDMPKSLKKAKERSVKQSKNASKDRKNKPTKEELIDLKEKWIFDKSYERGWIKEAVNCFGISRSTVSEIMKSNE